MNRTAECSCGELKVFCEGNPTRVSICHCNACKRQTGSSFGIAAFFPRTNVVIRGKFNTYQRTSDAGFVVDTRFCPTCGSTVFWEPERMPELIAVGAGAFADPAFPVPDQEVHTDDRHRWLPPVTG